MADDLPKFNKESIKLSTWTRQKLEIKGTITTEVEFKRQRYELPLIVIGRQGTSLLGRNWFNILGISLAGIQQIQRKQEIREAVFLEGLGAYVGTPINIEVDKDTKPLFLKSRAVPYALREKVDESYRLQTAGVLKAVQHSDWATPIVVILKKDGQVRLYGDYRATVNKVIKVGTYPLPTTQELLA